MKYCSKCGMLLEDNHDICIGCGTDVTKPGSYSSFPPGIEQSIQKEKTEEKKRGGTIILLVVVFVLLIAAITAFIVLNASSMSDSEPVQDVQTEEAEETEKTEKTETEDIAYNESDIEPEASNMTALNTDLVSDTGSTDTSTAPSDDNMVIKDDKGSYYVYTALKDLAGNTIFSTLYPEDFSPKVSQVKYDGYSTKFPESVTFIAGNDDGNVQFTFISPQHFWHRDSKMGKSRTNERNIKTYMMFLSYGGVEGYLDALIKQSYTDIKGFKLVDSKPFDEDMVKTLEDFSKLHAQSLAGITGDYASIAEDTTYAAMASDFEANIYSYEATTRQNNTIYMDFYVPMIANTLSYASEIENDMGNVIEWFPLEVVAFEAGNEELHDMYKDAFMTFIYNSRLSREFFYDNERFSDEIKAAVTDGKEPAPLTENKLKGYHEDLGDDTELSEFYKGVYEFTYEYPKDCKLYKNDSISVMCSSNIKTAYYNTDNKKLFISSEEDEYPGEPYKELNASESDSSD